MVTTIATPPETLEGWFALHQIYTCSGRHPDHPDTLLSTQIDDAARLMYRAVSDRTEGWSTVARLIGSSADLLVIHFRPTLDAIGEAQSRAGDAAVRADLSLEYSFLSVTEAGLYHLTAKLAAEAIARGGAVGDDLYAAQLKERIQAERGSDHVKKRLYPPLPPDMPYVCFYPMSKRREPEQNWYALGLDERSRLMQAHGQTGRRYAGRVQQIITGAIGFDSWEWGVTLFARDPLDFKKLVTEMRFDEVSARYADFGDFFVGRLTG